MAQSLDEPSIPSVGEMRSAEVFSYALMLLGIIVCGLVLVAYAIVAYQGPKSRKHLDRVSFRLLVGALVSNLIYGTALTLSHLDGGRDHRAVCEFESFATNFGYLLGIFFTACIAVNSQLVLIHEFNGKALEKYYFLVTVVLSLAICGSAYGSGQLGWNEEILWCWYNNPDRSTRVHWIIATQSTWVALAAVIESVSSFCVLFWLHREKSTIFSLFKRQPRMEGNGGSPHTSTIAMLGRDPKYRRIIVRIALYPIVSMFLNFFGVSLDLHLSITQVKSEPQFRLMVIDILLLGGRNIIYGAMAFGDPSFVNAVHELSGEQSMLSTRGFNAMASRMIHGAPLNLKETPSTGSTSSETIGTDSYATGPPVEEGVALASESPLGWEREDFKRLGAQL